MKVRANDWFSQLSWFVAVSTIPSVNPEGEKMVAPGRTSLPMATVPFEGVNANQAAGQLAVPA